MVKVNEVVPFKGMEAAPKDLMMTGGVEDTLRLAEAVPPVPPLIEVTLPVVLFFVPAVVPVTFTEKVQLLFPAMVAPESETVPLPAVEVMVPPPQLPVRPFGVDITRPAGMVSVKPISFRALELLF